ncbi:MAG TPA: hypothetical protein VMR41_06260 [Patescibacteria group bacterium]|nr:hypothetical protein [Patescibacteria group bacterium]
MTIKHQIEIDSVIILLLAAAAGFIVAYFVTHNTVQNKVSLPVVANFQDSNPTPNLIPTSTLIISVTPIPKPQVTSQLSPDGTKQLTMTVNTQSDQSKTYNFVTSNIDGTNLQTVYSINYPSNSDSMSIPFNTWSPDNNYVFITHTNPAGNEAIVLKADGSPIDVDASLNETVLFKAQNTADFYAETTGWASDTLLIINTKTTDGSQGTSYWFEVPTKAVIPLATQF